jgi:myo-inositol 2-dehydrogenase / D-chiro-inositol 1-dehydrogenase
MKKGVQRISRRGFLQGTAAAAAAPLVIGYGSTPAAAAAGLATAPPKPLRVGLVGCGGRGTGAASQALHVEDDVVLTAVADLFPDKIGPCLENLAKALGEERADRIQVAEESRFSGWDAYRKLIDGDVDVVLLATPPVFRPEHLRYAVEHSKHVFCEKPAAVDAPGVRSVLETAEIARQKRLSLVCGFCWRYNVRHRALWQRVHEGAIGDVRAFYSTYLASPNRVVERQPGWSDVESQIRDWFQILWLSGDHVVEQAVHSLDKQAWTFRDQPPLSVTAVGGRQTRKAGNIWDHFAATFDYEGGAKAVHVCRQSENCTYDNTDWIAGSLGTARINGWAPLLEIDGAHPWRYEGDGNDMYQQEHDELFASIRSGKPIDDGAWLATSTMLAIMVRMSAYTGKTITWEQAMESEERLAPETLEFGSLELRPVAVPGVTQFV